MTGRLQQRARSFRGGSGQATVELALCLPFVALLLAALVEAGLVVADHTRLWHAAREAARVAVVSPEVREIRTVAEGAGLRPLELSIQPGATGRVQGEPLTVSLSYRPRGRVPLLGRLFSHLQLHATATMRIEQP